MTEPDNNYWYSFFATVSFIYHGIYSFFAYQGCIYMIKKYSKNSKNLKYSYNLKELFSIWMYFKM